LAKRKAIMDLSSKNIEFFLERTLYKALNFNPNSMSLEVKIFEDGVEVGQQSMSFAHIPKEIKKIVKPN